jgi:adenylate cyclase
MAGVALHSRAVRNLSAVIPAPWTEELTAEIQALDRILQPRGQLERLLPPDVIDARPRPGKPSAVRRVLTIMFVDIRNSTRIEEQLPPEQTFNFLNTYLGAASRAIQLNNGIVYQFVGDGIVALFGGSDESDYGAANALAAALDIHHAIDDAHPPPGLAERVRAVVAVHTGLVTVGMVGPAERTQYAVLGSAVNIASRMEGEAKEHGLRTVMTGQTVWSLALRPSWLRRIAVKRLRGSSDTVEIWSAEPPLGA